MQRFQFTFYMNNGEIYVVSKQQPLSHSRAEETAMRAMTQTGFFRYRRGELLESEETFGIILLTNVNKVEISEIKEA